MVDEACGLPDSAGSAAPVDGAAEYLLALNGRAIDARVVAIFDKSFNQPPANQAEAGEEETADPAESLDTLLCAQCDTRARMAAAWKLGKIQSTAAVRSLVKALREGDEAAQVFAATALVSIGVPVVEPLVVALRDNNVEVRRKVIWVLWSVGDRRAVEPLIGCLGDSDHKVRAYAAWALGRLADARALPALIAALDDPHEKVRWDAAIALEKFGAQAIPALADALYDDRAPVRIGAANALGWLMDVRAIGALAAALRDSSPQVRQRAAFALGWIRDTGAVEVLIAALHDADEEVRMQAAAALGWIRDNRAIEPLAQLIEDDNEWTRYTAIEALADMQAVAPLEHARNSPHERVQEAATRALQRLSA
ncbi:MAG: HEAT repeat domain-containing protein [Chloroflexi bacterium]|nr:HEAT repeat domain-containing protein [Chloroflexota bacterium]